MQLGKTSTACILFAQLRLSPSAPPLLSPVLPLILTRRSGDQPCRSLYCAPGPTQSPGGSGEEHSPPNPKVVGLQPGSAPRAESQGLERNNSGKP